MIIDIPNAWHGRRRQPGEIDTLVIHAIAEWIVDTQNQAGGGHGRVYHCTDWLRALSRHGHSRSVHAFNLPDGRIVREVDSWYKAFHAAGYNTRSVGMEFVVPGVLTYDQFLKAIRRHHWPSPAQLESGVAWFRARLEEHGVARVPPSVVTHHEIDPERKLDPGPGFPLLDFRDAVLAE